MFLSTDEPEDIIDLIQTYPEFKPMYDEVYEMYRNIEGVMEMFSKELSILDRNTVQYMIDEMQETIDRQKKENEEQKKLYEEQRKTLERQYQEALQHIAELERQQKP